MLCELKFWLVVYVLLNSKSYGQDNQTVPDILLLSEEFFNITRLTCVADTNALDSAIVFNTKLNSYSESIYVPTNNRYKNIFNCNFANRNECNESYSNSNKTRIRKSGSHFIAPVLDERWEKFPLKYGDRIKIQNNQALSIKMNNKIKLYLAIGSSNIEEIDNPITGNETKWKHFAIRLFEDKNQITIFGSAQKTYSVNVNNFTNVFIRSNSNLLWKNHAYNYLELFKPVDFVQIGPEFTALRTQILCISMHVAVCQACNFQLQLMNETNHTVSNVVRVQGKLLNNMLHWNTIRLTASVAIGPYYKIVANNFHTYLIPHIISQPQFWTIDDIRECDMNEIRISKLYTIDPDVSCEALKFPDWNTKQNNRNRTEKVFNCKDDRYIGRNCNISCQSVLHSERCDRNILCQPTRESQESECRCVGGYFGANCNEDCTTGHVEYKCKVMHDHVNTSLMRINYECDENIKSCTTNSTQLIPQANYQMYLPLLSLLALPVIVFLFYWFVWKKLFDPHYIDVNPPRVGSYIEVINENDTGSIQNIQMTDQSNAFSIYVKNNTEVSEPEPIYGNIATEAAYANVILAGAPVVSLPENIDVNIYDFDVYVKNALKNQEFEKQYASISQNEMKPCKYGSLEANIYKNQYKNVLPYDENRVVLNIINGDPYSDYINASYIQGCRSKKDYIATQHPKQQTTNDFWRMIWQEDVKYIIMLSNSFDNNTLIKSNEGFDNYSMSRSDIKKQKSQPNYWPKLHTSEDYGMVNVAHLYTDSYLSYEIRTFEARIGTERKQIKQLAFTSWPDYDIPNHPQYFTEFMKYVSKIPQDNAPIVVHCSAGIGRTGVLILCDICLRMVYEDGIIRVLNSVQTLQKQRIRMINNTVHYKLVYLTLLDCLLSPQTDFSTDNGFYDHIRNMLSERNLQGKIDYLEKITFFENALVKKIKYTRDVTTDSKDRFADIVPEYDSIHLSDHEPKNKNAYYINAVPVDGYKKNNQFIVTQYPLPNTLPEFWQMVYKKYVKVIVSLNDIPENDMSCCEFWPTNNEEFKPIQSLSIEHVTTEHYEFHSVFTLVFKTLCLTNNVEDRTVYMIQLKGWAPNNNTPERIFNLFRIYGEIENLRSRKFPVVVACFNGATASGLFVALSYLIDQITEEDTCDVYAAIRVIRKNRKQFISNKEQLEFLYKGVLKYIHKLDDHQIYENLKRVK